MRNATLTLNLPPSVNSAYTTSAEGKRVMTSKAREWKKQAGMDIRAQLRGIRFLGCYRLSVRASDVALSHDRDADNMLKSLVDAVVKSGVVLDDNHRHMRGVSIDWDSALPEGQCLALIEELAPEPLPRPTAKARPKSKEIPASIMAALRARGIRVSPERVHVQ